MFDCYANRLLESQQTHSELKIPCTGKMFYQQYFREVALMQVLNGTEQWRTAYLFYYCEIGSGRSLERVVLLTHQTIKQYPNNALSKKKIAGVF